MMARWVLLLLCILSGFAKAGDLIDLQHQPLVLPGSTAFYYAETGQPISLDTAREAFRQGQFTPSSSPFLTFGIGASPHWIRIALLNSSADDLLRVLSIETTWLDHIELYLLQDDQLLTQTLMGDNFPFSQRPLNHRYFAQTLTLPSGTTELWMRVATPDPMLLPLYLGSYQVQQQRYEQDAYSYGVLYGVMLALLLYNLMLYTGIRHRQYLYYAIYVGLFVWLNLAYTGHGFRWLWPEAVTWQQWANPVLMILYGSSGLVFALSFLNIRNSAPRLYQAIQWLCITVILLLAVLLLIPQGRVAALYLAFSFILLGTLLMLLLGGVAWRAGNPASRYFLCASVIAALGGMITALSVWGLIPFSPAGYRAVDLGTMIEAVLLALALAEQFRRTQRQRLRAEAMARLDPLTGLNNRRAFAERVEPLWQSCVRYDRPMSLAIIDLDEFKKINDSFGHKAGDLALEMTAEALLQSIRGGDILARWGGEEFILFMPETTRDEAVRVAERLRTCIGTVQVREQDALISLSASIGVAARDEQIERLEQLICVADQCLYQAKMQGRNRVVLAHA